MYQYVLKRLGSSGVERRTENPCVGGSNPPLDKTKMKIKIITIKSQVFMDK